LFLVILWIMAVKQYYISERFFTKEEIKEFEATHGYDLKEIDYASATGEIDFSISDEKSFLLEKGYPKISARFFAF